ncbi:hypothetical protein OWV82_001693 [Melia azedarach]|uniref:Uncharacterized protein n=1 Tax=Melia azedarach TaxID=155640 RepID=A0ACC1YYF1_MELAZ|nr:hypothetical protein OWV82_001693 [Melia azedarach]
MHNFATEIYIYIKYKYVHFVREEYGKKLVHALNESVEASSRDGNGIFHGLRRSGWKEDCGVRLALDTEDSPPTSAYINVRIYCGNYHE